MSGGTSCKCAERREPLTAPPASNRPARLWRCVAYKHNYSAFNGYHYTPSDYSAISCVRCGAVWRTRADYAVLLSNLAEDEKFISSGYAGHAEAMERLGRTPYQRGKE